MAPEDEYTNRLIASNMIDICLRLKAIRQVAVGTEALTAESSVQIVEGIDQFLKTFASVAQMEFEAAVKDLER